MKKTLILGLLTSVALMMSGCGSNDFDVAGADGNTPDTPDTNGSNNTVAISFYNATTPLTIARPHTRYEISVQVLKNGLIQPDAVVALKPFDKKFGSARAYSVSTSVDGYARFDYTSPSIMPADGTKTTLMLLTADGQGRSIQQAINVIFDTTSTGGTPPPDNNETVPPQIVIKNSQKNVTINENSQRVNIRIAVFKNGAPYTQGKVKVTLPSKVLNGADVGLFDTYESNISSNGTATFQYTGPDNLSYLIDHGDEESVFGFYHSENSGELQNVTVHYEKPADQQPPLRNYSIDVSTNGDFSMGIPDQEKTFTITLEARDDKDEVVDLSQENITNFYIQTTNGLVAQIKDGQYLVDQKTLPFKASNTVTMVSKTHSGLVPLKVVVEFDDLNGQHKTLTKIMNIRVMSGPPSAISISYVGTTQDVERAKYIETLAISVTDAYGNKVNTHPNITVGAVVGYTVDGQEASNKESNETKRLFHGKSAIENDHANGMITPLDDHKAEFSDSTAARSNVFKYVNAEGRNTDKLLVFGAGKNYEAMGKWDFAKSDNHTLRLEDNYFGVERTGLYYAVGHNYYQDQCRDDGREWIGNTDSDSYQVDEEGTVTVKYAYDYHLTGKDALIWVNLDGLQPDTGKKTRIGEVTKHTLRGTGLEQEPSGGYSLQKGVGPDSNVTATFIIWHENAPERYRNAHFSYAIASGSTCGYEKVISSNPFDARTCNNGVSSDGTSYVTFHIWSAPDKGCTFNLDRIMTSREF